MALLVADKLTVQTDIGECSIELCFGDITKLPREEAVDVLVVSAFSGMQASKRSQDNYELNYKVCF